MLCPKHREGSGGGFATDSGFGQWVQMSVHAAPGRLQMFTATLRRPGMVRAVTGTAAYNISATVAAGLGGIILARALGPTLRGEYAAITAWFGIVIIVGGMGQPAALCFYVARDPARATGYVATSRVMMLATGAAAVVAGILVASILAHGNTAEAVGYKIAFSASIANFVGASYTFSLQARDLRRWNLARMTQPTVSLFAIVVLWRLHLLNLDTTLLILGSSMLTQLGCSYWTCRRVALAPGRFDSTLIRPLTAYGLAQIAALTPTVLNAQLDQLVLSQAVPPADLGRYAIAVSLTSLPVPLVAALGNVAFPRLASERAISKSNYKLQRVAVVGSAVIAAGFLLPLAVVARWLIPLVFGSAYAGAVPLLWILTPGSIFLACGQVVADLLRGRNRPIVVAWAQGLAALFTVVLLLLLLPFIGVAGAAIASTIAYGVALAGMLRSLWRLPHSEAEMG
jgi:O-antigen/teichoic acid export membrane protein